MTWETKAVEDFADVVTGGTPSTKKEDYWGGQIPWLGSGELNAGEVNESKKFITDLGLQNSAAKMMPPHTVMMALTGATVGVTGYLNISACANQSVTGVLPSDNHDSRYLFYFFKSIRKKVIDDAYGGGQPHISQGYVKKIQVPLPPLEEQKRIAEILDEADRVRKKTQALIDKYDELAQSLFLDMFGDPVTNPKGWEVKPLGEISESRLGKMLDQKKQTGNELRPYIKNTNVKWFKFDLKELPEMDFDSDDRVEFQLMIGDILVCEGGEVGRCAIWKGEVEECYFQKALHRVRLNSDFLDGNYFKHWMKASSENGVLDAISVAATIPHLTGAKLKKLEIMTPPKERQVMFSVQIDSIERQQSELLRQVESSVNLTNALLQKAFKGELTSKLNAA